MHLLKILIAEGYKSKHGEQSNTDFSSMVKGGLDVRYVKGSSEIIWGHHERGKPPTLIYPRPQIECDGVGTLGGNKTDDNMNK